jgi:hypothetical protein
MPVFPASNDAIIVYHFSQLSIGQPPYFEKITLTTNACPYETLAIFLPPSSVHVNPDFGTTIVLRQFLNTDVAKIYRPDGNAPCHSIVPATNAKPMKPTTAIQ